jgi:hypothetical protein
MMPACRTNLDYINRGWIHMAEDTALRTFSFINASEGLNKFKCVHAIRYESECSQSS